MHPEKEKEDVKPFDFIAYAEGQMTVYNQIFCANESELWKLILHFRKQYNTNEFEIEFAHGGVYLKKKTPSWQSS